jgi:hypothetical protein
VDDLSEAWSAAGEYIPAEVQGIVDEMLTMNGLTEEQRSLLAEMSSAAVPDFKRMTALAHEYGIELADLGPTFQQANINDTAAQIFRDFDQITRAGGDVVGVLFGMTDEIQKLVSDSQKFGSTIPDNMKPLIENLINAGRLTDDAGNAISDMSQLNFGATPLDRSTSAIVDAVHELRDALLALPGAAARAADGMSDSFGGFTFNPPPAANPGYEMTRLAGLGRPSGDMLSGFGRGVPLQVNVAVDGRVAARAFIPHLYDQARLLGAV